MEVICIETDAFHQLVDTVYQKLKDTNTVHDRWLDSEEAMRLLNIKSSTTLQKLRDEGCIRFSQPQKRIIVYDRESIESYLEKHAKSTF